MVSFKNLAIVTLAVTTTSVEGISFSNIYLNKAITIFKHPTSLIPSFSNSKLINYQNTKPIPGDSPIEVCDASENNCYI